VWFRWAPYLSWNHAVTAADSRATYKLSAEHVIVVDVQLCRYCHKTSHYIQLHSGTRVEQSRRRVCYDVIPGTNSWQRQNIGCPTKSARFNFVINSPFIQKVLIFLFQYKVNILRLIVEHNIRQMAPTTQQSRGGRQCAHFKSCALLGTPHICCCPPLPEGLWCPPNIIADRYPCGFFV